MLQTKTKIAVITLKTSNAHTWVNDNIVLSENQYDKNDETGNITIEIDSTFVDELLDEMQDELTDKMDFEVLN